MPIECNAAEQKRAWDAVVCAMDGRESVKDHVLRHLAGVTTPESWMQTIPDPAVTEGAARAEEAVKGARLAGALARCLYEVRYEEALQEDPVLADEQWLCRPEYSIYVQMTPANRMLLTWECFYRFVFQLHTRRSGSTSLAMSQANFGLFLLSCCEATQAQLEDAPARSGVSTDLFPIIQEAVREYSRWLQAAAGKAVIQEAGT